MASTPFKKVGVNELSSEDQTVRAEMDKGGRDWRQIQLKAFTNWVNERLRRPLKHSAFQISAMTDMSDGIILIKLLEKLAKKKFPRHNQNPKIKQQKLENLLQALKFIKEEKIKLVNIGAEDLLDGNEKLWMGLIWSLISKYQIKMGGKVSAKKAMMNWVTSLIPDYPIKNFATDWNNGIALCKLIDRIQPGLCPNHASLDPNKGLDNCKLGMDLAEKHLRVPLVLDPEDLNNSELDELSVMTYLSYFTDSMNDALMEWIQSKIPQHNIKNYSTDWNNGVALAALVDAICPGLFPEHDELQPTKALENVKRAMDIAEKRLSVPSVITPVEVTDPKVDELSMATYLMGFQSTKLKLPPEAMGPGLEAAAINQEAMFTVDASKSGPGDVKVVVTGPNGKLPAQCAESKPRSGQYNVSYTPEEVGRFQIEVLFDNVHVSESPYDITVCDPTKCFVTGESLGGVGGTVGSPLTFTVDGSQAGPGKSSATLKTPDDAVQPMTNKPRADDKAVCDLQAEPTAPGLYRLEVTWAGHQVPGSPFSIVLSDPGSCRLLNKPKEDYLHRTGNSLELVVDASRAGPGTLTATSSATSGSMHLASVPGQDGHWKVPFNPDKPGYYTVQLLWAGHEIKDSPLTVPVIDPSLCTFAKVPKSTQVSQPMALSISTNQPVLAALTSRIQNTDSSLLPSSQESAGTSEDNGEMFHVSFTPAQVGTLKVDVLWAGERVATCPFDLTVCDSSKCSAYGPGLLSDGRVSQPVEFEVRTKGAGDGELDVRPHGPNATYTPTVQEKDGGTYSVSFTPWESGPHTVDVDWAGTPIPNAPFPLTILPKVTASLLSATGDGLTKALSLTPAHFTVHSPEASLLGEDRLVVTVKSDDNEAEVEAKDCGDGTYPVQYITPTSGIYNINITYAGEHIPQSPYRVEVLPRPDASKCIAHAECLEPNARLLTGSPLDIGVSTKDAGRGELNFKAEKPDGTAARTFLSVEEDGEYLIRVDTPIPGRYTVHITWSGEDIPRSPFFLNVITRLTAAEMSAFGDGLKKAVTKTPANFIIEAVKPGLHASGQLSVVIKSERTEAEPTVQDEGNGKYSITYTPSAAEDHQISICYEDHHIPGSPFRATVLERSEPSKCLPDGSCLSPDTVLVSGDPIDLAVATKDAGHGQLHVTATGPGDEPIGAFLAQKDNGEVGVHVETKGPGCYVVNVLWNNEHIPKSPFTFNIAKRLTAVDIEALGDGLVKGFTNTSANFTINAAKAGLHDNNQLTIIAKGKDITAETTMTDEGNGKYNVAYTPTTAEDYQIAICYEEQHIPGSPFRATILEQPDASKCVAEGDCLSPGAVLVDGDPLDITVTTKDAGHGKLHATATGPGNKPTGVFLAEREDGKVGVRVESQGPGHYMMNVLWNNNHIPNSPFAFALIKRLTATDMGAFGHGLVKGFTNTPANFTINAVKAGLHDNNQLTIMTKGKDVAAETTVTDEGNGKYNVTYTPTTAEDYQIAICYEEQHIPGSPFRATILEQPDASKCVAEGDCLSPGAVLVDGDPLDMAVATKDAGHGKLHATATGPGNKPTGVFLAERDDGRVGVRVESRGPGHYVVNVLWNDDHIPKSPFAFDLIKRLTAADMEAFGEGLIKGFTGVPVKFTVDATKAGLFASGQLTITVSNKTTTAKVDVEDTDGKYSVAYTASSADDYHIAICYEKQHIPGSPFRATILKQPAASKCVAHGACLSPNATLVHGDPLEMLVSTKDAGHGQLRVTATGPDNKPAGVFLAEEKDGEIAVRVEAKSPGHYVLNVFWNEDHIGGSPFHFDLIPRLTAADMSATGEGLVSAFTTTAANFVINGTKPGLHASGQLVITVASNKAAAAVTVHDDGDGKYPVSYIAQTAEDYQITVRYNEQHIPGSPFRATVLERSLASKCVAQGDCLSTGAQLLGGDPLDLIVSTKEAGHGGLRATAIGPSDGAVPVFLADQEEGKVAVHVVTKEAGRYTVNILWNEEHIPRSPFAFNVVQRLTAANMAASGDGLVKGQTASPANFTINAVRPGLFSGGQLTVKISSDNDTPTAAVCDEGNGKYSMTYTPKVAEDYWIAVCYEEWHIPGSPFRATVSERPDVSECTAAGDCLAGDSRLVNGDPLDILISTKDAGQGKLSASAIGPDNIPIDAFLSEKADGAIVVHVETKLAGRYVVNVFWNDQHIPRSPFHFDVAQKVTASDVKAYGDGLSKAVTNSPAIFTVDAVKAGLHSSGQLQVSIHHENGSDDVVVQDKGNGQYIVTYTPTTAADHNAVIKYEDWHVAGSPFRVTVVEQSKAESVTVDGAGLSSDAEYVVGVPVELSIATAGCGDGKLDISATGPDGGEVLAYYRDCGKGRVAVRVDTPTAGEYTVAILWSGQHVPKSPFRLFVVDPVTPDKIKVHGPGLEKAMTMEQTHFVIDAVKEGLSSSGLLQVSVSGQTAMYAPATKFNDEGGGCYKVFYTPAVAEEHLVSVRFKEKDIPGSPFHVTVTARPDATKCTAEGTCLQPHAELAAGVPLEFTVSTRDAGDGKFTASASGPDGSELPVFFNAQPDGQFTVRVDAPAAGEYTINVLWSGEHVRNSPFKFKVTEILAAKDMKAYGDGLVKAFEKLPAQFTIDALKPGLFASGKLTVFVSCDDTVADMKVNDEGNGKYGVVYTASTVDNYQASIRYENEHILSSPFPITVQRKAGAANCVLKGDCLAIGAHLVVGDPVEFDLSVDDAGEGPLTVSTTGPDGQSVPAYTSDKGDNVYAIRIECQTVGHYTAAVCWRGDHVPGSPLHFLVANRLSADQMKAYGNGLCKAQPGAPAKFTIEAVEGGLKESNRLQVSVASDDSDNHDVIITDRGHGTYGVMYTPSTAGDYWISVRFEHSHIPGSPFQVTVAETKEDELPTLAAPIIGPEIRFNHSADVLQAGGDVGAIEFLVTQGEADPGQLQVMAVGPDGQKARVVLSEGQDDSWLVRVETGTSGRYTVNVIWAGVTVPGSPFFFDVGRHLSALSMHAHGDGLQKAVAGTSAKFTISAIQPGLHESGALKVNVWSGESAAVVTVQDTGDGKYVVMYTALMPGDYEIDVCYKNQHIIGSPYTASVSKKPSAAQCNISGGALDKGTKLTTGKPIDFDLSTESAGDGVLSVRAEGPQGEPIDVYTCARDSHRSGLRVDTNNGPGGYKVFVQWSGEDVPGSPFVFNIESDKGSAIHASGEGLREATALREATFNIHAPTDGLFQSSQLKVRVEGKDGQLGVAVDDQGHGVYCVTYQAPTPGTYRIDILHKGQHIAGSPFSAEIFMPPVAHRCIARGRCLEPSATVTVGEPTEFSVNTQNAGRGKLAVIAVDSNSEPLQTFTSDEGNGLHSIRFTPREPGRYEITITWSGVQIPGSPFTVKAFEGLAAASILATGNALSRAFALVPAAFNIDAIEPGLFENGDLTVSVDGALRQKVEINARDLGDGSYSVTYVAPTTGAYLASIRYRKTHIPGSPFKIAVHHRPRPEKCVAKGSCFEPKVQIKGGEPLQFTVFSKDAGFGRLNVTAVNPSGDSVPAYVAEESREKHKVRIDTKEPGRYTINVKWGSIHIPSSPFKVRVYPPPDASKVVVEGPGIQSGLHTDHETYFWIGTHHAGLGQLHVRMHGIKDGFKIKVEAPDSRDPRQLRATYTPTKPGNYEITISWSGMPVPGSPFKLEIIDPRKVPESERRKSPTLRKRFTKTKRIVGGGSVSQAYEEHGVVEEQAMQRTSVAHGRGPSQMTIGQGQQGHMLVRQRSGSARRAQHERPLSWVEEDFERARVPVVIDGAQMMDPLEARRRVGRSKTDDDLYDEAFASLEPTLIPTKGGRKKMVKAKSFSGEAQDSSSYGLFGRKKKEKVHPRRQTTPAALGEAMITAPRGHGMVLSPSMDASRRGQLTGELRGRPYQLQYNPPPPNQHVMYPEQGTLYDEESQHFEHQYSAAPDFRGYPSDPNQAIVARASYQPDSTFVPNEYNVGQFVQEDLTYQTSFAQPVSMPRQAIAMTPQAVAVPMDERDLASWHEQAAMQEPGRRPQYFYNPDSYAMY